MRTGWAAWLPDGLRIGLVLGLVWTGLWILAVFVRTPEPQMFLDAIRGSAGPEWDLANCFHCPTFIVLERGFGTGYESPPLTLLTLWSIPAVQMARAWSATSQQLELSPLAFVGALFLQWGIFGLVARASMQVLVTRRPARA